MGGNNARHYNDAIKEKIVPRHRKELPTPSPITPGFAPDKPRAGGVSDCCTTIVPSMREVFSHLTVFPLGRAFSHLIFILFCGAPTGAQKRKRRSNRGPKAQAARQPGPNSASGAPTSAEKHKRRRRKAQAAATRRPGPKSTSGGSRSQRAQATGVTKRNED